MSLIIPLYALRKHAIMAKIHFIMAYRDETRHPRAGRAPSLKA